MMRSARFVRPVANNLNTLNRFICNDFLSLKVDRAKITNRNQKQNKKKSNENETRKKMKERNSAATTNVQLQNANCISLVELIIDLNRANQWGENKSQQQKQARTQIDSIDITINNENAAISCHWPRERSKEIFLQEIILSVILNDWESHFNAIQLCCRVEWLLEIRTNPHWIR